MAKTFTPLATYTLASTSSEISFTGLSGYDDYQIHAVYSCSSSANIYVRFNSNSSNYLATYHYGNASTNSTSRQTTIYTNHPTSVGTNYVYDILDIIAPHNTTNYKACLIHHSAPTEKIVSYISGLWKDASNTTSIQLTNTGTFAVGSNFTIYGILAA